MAEITPRVPPLLNRWSVALIAGLVAALFFHLLQPILLPFVLGAVIAYLGDPVVDMLARRGLNRTLGVVLVFVVFAALVVAAMILAVPLLLHQLDLLLARIPVIYAWFAQDALPWVQQRFDLTLKRLPPLDWTGQLANHWQALGEVTARTLVKVSGSGAGLLLGIANLALVPVVAFYLMRDWDRLVDKTLGMLPLVWQGKAAHIVGEADEVVSAFLRGQFLVMCTLGAVYSFGLWLVGLQLALLLGVMAGLASIVPYLGFIVGVLASCLAAYTQFGDWSVLLWVLLVFGTGQAIESMVLTPVLVGDRIGLHPVAVIFALMAGGQVAGFVGVLVALPVAAVIAVFLRHALEHYRASDIYGGS
ncbi:MAG: AI-2E family transporter [Gammaproteobacteria bacterium]|nr:AI-2E family transporter [Gammaproteobacteria bacterium]MDH5172177.1 AI-2E family transporter [Gammaproteobacteria bacterium]